MGIDSLNFEEIKEINNPKDTENIIYQSPINSDSMVNSRTSEKIESATDLAEVDLLLVKSVNGNLIQLVGQPDEYMTENGTIITDQEGNKILLISSKEVSGMSRKELNAYCDGMDIDYLIYDKDILKNTKKGVYFYDPSNGGKLSGYGQDFNVNSELGKDAQIKNMSIAYDKVLQKANDMILNKRSDIKRDGSLNIKKNIYHGDNGHSGLIEK